MKNIKLYFTLFFIFSFTFSIKAQSDWLDDFIPIDKKMSIVTKQEKEWINEVFGDKAEMLIWNASNVEFKNALVKLIRERITYIKASDFKKIKKHI